MLLADATVQYHVTCPNGCDGGFETIEPDLGTDLSLSVTTCFETWRCPICQQEYLLRHALPVRVGRPR